MGRRKVITQKLDPYEVARRYWEMPVEARGFKHVARSFQLADAGSSKVVNNHLSRLARDWEEAGRVRHIVLPPHRLDDDNGTQLLPRVPELELNLLRRYPRLRHVAVVDVSCIRLPAQPKLPDVFARDDQIHQALGDWAAAVFLGAMRNGDVIGASNGRGAFYAASGLARMNPEGLNRTAIKPRRIVSFMGFTNTARWGRRVKSNEPTVPMEADFVAYQFGSFFGIDDYVGHPIPITQKTAAAMRTLRAAAQEVTIATVSLGSLAGGHSFLVNRHLPALAGIRGILDELEALVHAIKPSDRLAYPAAIGDVCNHLFVTSAARQALPRKTLARLEKLLDQLNGQLLTIQPTELDTICGRGAVIGVGGGPYKLDAIADVIRRDPPTISHLVTDSEVATQLLSAKS